MARSDKEKNNNDAGNHRDDEMTPDLDRFKEKILKNKKRKKKETPEKGITEELEVEELENEIKVLRNELKEYKKIEEEYIDRLKRLQADYDNYRKRMIKEHLEHIKRANKELVSKLLPILDNFEMALEVGEELKRTGDDLYKGVKMIYENLLELLKKENVTIIEPLGKEFDPRVCEAAVTERVDDVEEGMILEVLRKGYKMDDFVIRPAVVKVCKKN